MKNFDKEYELEKVLKYFDEEKGLADIFVGNMNSVIKLIDDTHGYIYNPNKCLWENCKSNDIIYKISDHFQQNKIYIKERVIGAYDKFIESIKDYETKEKILLEKNIKLKEIDKVLKRCLKYNCSKNIYDYAKVKLLDKDFKFKINSMSYLLPISNCKVINLKTLKVRDRMLNDYFDFELDVNYTFNCTKAIDFFTKICNNNKDIINYLQKILGYSITAETTERSIYIFWGKGSNGKSAIMDLINTVFNKFYQTVDRKVFMKDKNNSNHTSHLVPLMNCRIACYCESEDGDKLNSGLIKSLTGNDLITCRQLYGEQFTFKPFAKYFILTNNKPQFSASDSALIDRICFIHFNAKFVDDPKENEFKKDPKLIDELKTKYKDEIFSWICQGAYEYYKLLSKNKRIKVPEIIKKAKEEYIKEMDNVMLFINEKCCIDEISRIPRTELYNYYINWYKDNIDNNKPKATDFYKRLDQLDYQFVMVKGTRYIKGLIYNK